MNQNTRIRSKPVPEHYDDVLSGHFRSLLAQFGLTPKSKRGLAASDPVEAHQAARCVLHLRAGSACALRACVTDYARFA